jgi:hypothetical protein
LARAKRLRQLQVKHKWNRDEYMTANELISEPGPYGLHASMYLVSCSCVTYPIELPDLTSSQNDPPPLTSLTSSRQLSEIKELLSNTNSSSNPPKHTEPLGVMHRLNWAMDRMCEVSRRLLHGIRMTRPSLFTHLI